MTRAAILARVSTTGQADADRHSLPVQTEMMERLAERNGWDVVGLLHARREFVESSTPGWTRTELTQRWLVLPAELGVAS